MGKRIIVQYDNIIHSYIIGKIMKEFQKCLNL